MSGGEEVTKVKSRGMWWFIAKWGLIGSLAGFSVGMPLLLLTKRFSVMFIALGAIVITCSALSTAELVKYKREYFSEASREDRRGGTDREPA